MVIDYIIGIIACLIVIATIYGLFRNYKKKKNLCLGCSGKCNECKQNKNSNMPK